MRTFTDKQGRTFVDRGLGFVEAAPLGQATAPPRDDQPSVAFAPMPVPPTFAAPAYTAPPRQEQIPASVAIAPIPPTRGYQQLPPRQMGCPPPGYPAHTQARGGSCCVPEPCVPAVSRNVTVEECHRFAEGGAEAWVRGAAGSEGRECCFRYKDTEGKDRVDCTPIIESGGGNA